MKKKNKLHIEAGAKILAFYFSRQGECSKKREKRYYFCLKVNFGLLTITNATKQATVAISAP